MVEHIPCLVRVGDNVKKHRLLFLEKSQVTIGRSPEVTHCLLSVVISRVHAIVRRQENGKWTVTDNKSLNGVIVNGKRLVPMVAHTLSDGDIVKLGLPPKPEATSEFVYEFKSSVKVRRQRTSPDDDGPAKKRLKTHLNAIHVKSDENCRPSTSDEDRISADHGQPHSPYKSYKAKLEQFEVEQAEALSKFQQQLEEMQRKLHQKEQEQEQMREALEQEKQQRVSQAAALDNLKQKEEEMMQELVSKQEEMEKERRDLEEKMQAELEKKLKEREVELSERLSNERNTLLDEKKKIEASLQEEMAKALEQKDKQLEEKLIKQKEQLDNVIAEKELKQKMLESQLQATEAEKEKQKETTLRAREDVLANFTDLMETELQCSICNELFVQATSLNCSHAFCALCINQWMEKKKNCPVCRAAVTSHLRSIVLDSYIDKMVEHLTDELMESRKQLVQNRKEEQAKWDEKHKTKQGTPSPVRGRRGRPIIVESEEESEEEEEEEEEESDQWDSEQSGEEGVFYGGYGRCYSCGRRGHWANGCPN